MLNARRLALLVLANFIAVAALWLVLLLVGAIGEDVYLLAKRRFFPKISERVWLPNYPDKDKARRMFQDYRKMEETYVPYVAWMRLPLASENVNIGPDGRRVHTRGPENNHSRTATIGFFGGSTMLGEGADDNGTIPAIFDQISSDYGVTNYGQGGYNTRQMLALLINRINTRQMPEIVVFYDGYNHVWTHCNYGVTRLLNSHMAEQKLTRALAEKGPWAYSYEEIVMPVVYRARRIIGLKRFVHDEPACHADPVRAEQVAENLVRNWEMAALLVEAFGGRFYAFLQPVSYLGSPRFDHLEVKHSINAEQFPVVYPIIQAKLAERRVPWFTDLSADFDGDEYLYIDDVHVSRNGNEIIARSMLERISAGGVDEAN